MEPVRLAVCLCAAALAAACGEAAPASTASPSARGSATPAIAGPAAIDPCVVGTWRSSAITGSFTVAGAPLQLTGGAGEILTIGPSGALHTDDTKTAPVAGTTPDGTQYLLVQTGVATGTVQTGNGRLTVALQQPTQFTITLYKNGNVVQRQHPGTANDTYTCAAGSSLAITGAGGTVSRYQPA